MNMDDGSCFSLAPSGWVVHVGSLWKSSSGKNLYVEDLTNLKMNSTASPRFPESVHSP